MTYKSSDICKIIYYNEDQFDVGIILSNDSNHLMFIDFNLFGEYNGYVFQENERVEKLIHKGQYLSLMKSIINLDSIPYLPLHRKTDFIYEAINNNRVLGITKSTDYVEEITDIKVLEFDGIYVKYREYTRYASLNRRISKVKITNIVFIQIDSKYQRLIEKYREE